MARALDIIILAAGRGTRMPGDRPKVLNALFGEPLIQHVIDEARALVPREIGVIVGYRKEDVRTALAGQDVSFCVQREPQGTGDAVRACRRRFANRDGDVMVLSGDVPLVRGASLKKLLAAHRRRRAASSLFTAVPDDAGSLGRIVRDRTGHLEAIVEARDATPEVLAIREINAGIYVFRNEALFDGLRKIRRHEGSGEFYLTDVVRDLAQAGSRVVAEVLDDPSEAHGINTFMELTRAHSVLRSRILVEHAARGVSFVDPSSTFVAKGVKIGSDTEICPFSVIQAGVSIGARCRIGPFAHLRHGTVIGDDARVGNFVEVKDSRIGAGSSVAHLSFLGDATVGHDVNVGAGTITANFDGISHQSTQVGDGASVGSGTLIVAPNRVGKGATTGAGAVLPAGQEVADGETVVGVPARRLATLSKTRKRATAPKKRTRVRGDRRRKGSTS